MKTVLFFLLPLAIVVALIGLAVLSLKRSEAQSRAASGAHWNQVAADILAHDPSADVSWCFRPGRPPRRNPSAPSLVGERKGAHHARAGSPA